MIRRPFHRAPEGERRQELIEATLDCIAELGLKGATVRQIALRAGVTAGLVRHYFDSKDQMVADAYRLVLSTFAAKAVDIEGDARTRLCRFIALNLTAPVANARSLSLWASFISHVRVDPVLAAIHREGYLGFRNDLQALIADVLNAEGRPYAESECRRLSIAINGIIDGLWLEGCLAGELFAETELVSIALNSAEALLGLPLGSYEPGSNEKDGTASALRLPEGADVHEE
ncbi:AcrR family transcriptional regulator [Pararhizobium capsulatum DSM 1112]|uniref:AcrR family transcriptional regulator n=1 Tax=Pararhizobium capsulatum DSM 1112 TaxID=1121113 RepID=A0ABU0BKZ1_9HYPH|nr:TetR family transcriptional regulator C-terminal domain-containing protein [Pararhizobium capsulatum]MDQ0318912.1 AcrR family transcriptional regulator [Pararhizobium capsulatum DSM 1112]